LSFAKERIGPLAVIVTIVFYLLAFYLFALSNTPENPFASIYSETLIKTTNQHLLLLVGFDTLIYRKYYVTPPILMGHQLSTRTDACVDISLQETRLNVIDRFLVMQCLGSSFDEFAYLPVMDTRGGILLAWDSTVLSVTNIVLDSFSLTGHVKMLDQKNWWITVVYGPQEDADKIQFLQEVTERRSLCPGPWILLGDFNLILRASEKNNENLNRPMMNRFRHFVSNLELKELYMHGCLFTWSSEWENPMLSRIDRALVSVDWDLNNPDSFL
jgi:hypothetical protein